MAAVEGFADVPETATNMPPPNVTEVQIDDVGAVCVAQVLPSAEV
jgi:hypothetical protein